MPYRIRQRFTRRSQYICFKKRYFVILLLAFLAACKKDRNNVIPPPVTPPVDTKSVVVTLDDNNPGYAISPNFQGLSLETDLLTSDPDYLNVKNTALVQLLKNLGPGVIRIGGGTSDLIGWTGKPRIASDGTTMLTTSDVDRLAAFTKAVDWQVIFGLNMANNNQVSATNEATYAANVLGSHLFSFQAGNEPDMFDREGLRPAPYDVYAYSKDWDRYYTSIKQQLPQAQFAGPDIANNSQWVNLFVEDESTNLKMLDAHFYVTGPATASYITKADILSPAFGLTAYLANLNNQASLYKIPYRITECNSIWGGGKEGVSDTFAATLWALDFMWQVAAAHGQGINFHGGTLRTANLYYSPILNMNGKFTAMPEYYAMLAFGYASAGCKIIPATFNDNTIANCTAYACVDGQGNYNVTLINKEADKDLSITLNVNKSAATARIWRLKAPSLDSKTDVKFADASVNDDGTFVPGAGENQPVSSGKVVIKIPAGSAAVVTIH
jgi:hypothetical protein